MKKSLLLIAGILAVPAHAQQAPQSRVFIASDSTAQDYKPERYPQSGWGTMLRCAFDPGVTVENRAIGGRSTRSFINEGRLDRIAADIRKGDTLLIQFGHNDASKDKPERYTPVEDYKVLLVRYIDVARKAGAQPVLLTPVTRRNFNGALVVPSFPAYSAAVREVAKATHTPMIDLDTLSGAWVQSAGPEASKRYFLHYPPNGPGLPAFANGIDDDTHFSEMGARGVANIVAEALAKLHLPVSRHILADRPALTLGSPIGNSSCDIPVGYGRQSFAFDATGHLAVPLPEGNYRVTLTFGDRKAAGDATIKAEQRRLMLQDVRTARGQFTTHSFVVNIRNARLTAPPENAPGGVAVRLKPRELDSATWDDKLSLELLGPAPHVSALTVERVDLPTVFLFGDSTVTDQRCEPGASWGQMLTAFFGPNAAVANHAESGETLKSFVTELRLDKALSFMKPGDYALIQFGHNDQKVQWPQTYADAANTYRAYLRTYIAEVRRHGATPLLLTSPERRNFTPDGHIRPTLADYAAAVRAVAAEEKVAVIDLNAMSIAFYEALGPAKALLAFGNGGKDATHHDDYGAWILARSVAEGIRTSGSPLAALLSPGLVPFDPAHPIMPEDFHLAPSPACVEPPLAGS